MSLMPLPLSGWVRVSVSLSELPLILMILILNLLFHFLLILLSVKDEVVVIINRKPENHDR